MAAAGYPIRLNAWRAMLEYPQRMANIGINTTLQLRYQNLKDADAALFGVAWRSSLNGAIPLTLPAQLVAGVVDPTLQSRLLTPQGLVPCFAPRDPLSLEAAKPGRTSVALTLVFELRGLVP
jgi:hypothetical protein